MRIRPDHDLGGVEWLANKLGRRLHAASGGWCGRHIARVCPKNAAEGCYFCDDFQTEPGLLHIHEDTLARTLELKATAEQAGRSRQVEKNEAMATAIRHLIERVHRDEAATHAAAQETHSSKEPTVDAS